MNNDFLKIKDSINAIPAKLEKPDCKPEIFWQHYPYLNIYGMLPNGSSSNDYVDLGLPSGILWASKNIGASVPEETGYYFAGGETPSGNKQNYAGSTYKYGSGTGTLTKYVTKSNFGTVDNLTILEPEDDAAYVNLGEKGCTPTYTMFQELLDNTTATRVTQNNVSGVLLTSNINSNSIFFPYTCYKRETETQGISNSGYCGCSNVNSTTPNSAGYFYFDENNVYTENFYSNRCYGYTIRPVYKP